ncbi:MAG: MarR family transcriptional regulator [Acidimicrobiia bacterium]|nr:MarR family transcriptional regulator [Acidimicrobiia bacterium]
MSPPTSASPPGPPGPGVPRVLGEDDYRELAAFRHGLRRYLRWAEERAQEAGLTPAQHQLMLAIRGRGPAAAPTISQLAAELLLRHHSAVGLVDRAVAAGLVRRTADPHDLRVVRVALSPEGAERLRFLASQHVIELGRLGLTLGRMADGLDIDR